MSDREVRNRIECIPQIKILQIECISSYPGYMIYPGSFAATALPFAIHVFTYTIREKIHIKQKNKVKY